jgi:asparagine synthase (glutamine-hydrolysing)
MCGIAGIMRFDEEQVTYAQMAQIIAKIAHRGRDHSDILLGSKRAGADAPITRQAEIGLGHRRLSIIDLQDAAAQPMFYADDQLCLTYNGEIYNYLSLRKLLQQKSYTFKTNTDSEVLLAAYHFWGESCVNYLNGMFAFAIWDEKNKKLFCARDAVGIKPFYYIQTSQYFAFASESLALAHLNSGKLNHAGVSAYFLSMYVATNESIFAGIKKLPAGHSMSLQLDGSVAVKRFWSVKQFEGTTTSPATLSELNEVITHAVKQQLQSDVPVGGFLSGGVDSGLITALAAPQLSTYYTYSVGYEGMAVNELVHAKAIAQRYHTRHTEVTLRAADAMGILDNALNHLSEPIADPAIVATYHLTQLAGKDGVKVLLNGTGGDEIFGGYTRYSGQLSLKRKLLAMLPLALKKSLAALPLNLKLKRRLQQPAFDMLFSTGGSFTLAEELASGHIFSSFLNQLGEQFSALENVDVPLLYQQMLFDLQVYLPDQLLFLLDQMTMAHTIEGRVPLLDVNIINMAFNFIAKEHMRGGQTKVILKKIAEPYLGTEHIHRKKQGFAGSPSWWVQHNLGQFKDGIAQLKNMPFFDDFNIDTFLALANPTEKQANEMFMLYCYSKWHKRTQTVLSSSQGISHGL